MEVGLSLPIGACRLARSPWRRFFRSARLPTAPGYSTRFGSATVSSPSHAWKPWRSSPRSRRDAARQARDRLRGQFCVPASDRVRGPMGESGRDQRRPRVVLRVHGRERRDGHGGGGPARCGPWRSGRPSASGASKRASTSSASYGTPRRCPTGARYYQFEDLVLEPRPLQQPMPIWIANDPNLKRPELARRAMRACRGARRRVDDRRRSDAGRVRRPVGAPVPMLGRRRAGSACVPDVLSHDDQY